MIKSLLAFALLGSVLVSASYGAGEAAALKNTNASRLAKDDLALMRSRVMQSLAQSADGETLTWKSDKSKASGSVTALGRVSRSGMACRKVRIVNVIAESSREGVYRFCEVPTGHWKLDGPDKD